MNRSWWRRARRAAASPVGPLLALALALAGAAAHAGDRLYAHATGGHVHETQTPQRASLDGGRRKVARSTHAYRIPDVMLVETSGARVSLAAVLREDAPTFVNFVFTTCSAICPVMSATFAQVQQQLGAERDRVRMISISIDPEQDSPENLSAYARRYDAGPHWRFFTGAAADVDAVLRAFDAYRGTKMSHEPLTLLRASPRAAWVRLDGLATAGDLMAEYRRMVAR